MKAIKVPTQTVDMTTGKVTKESVTNFHLVPPPKGHCQECGVRHDPNLPHDAMKLHYQYSFYAEYDRWPTWTDAMSHCTPALREAWTAKLKELGLWSRLNKES